MGWNDHAARCTACPGVAPPRGIVLSVGIPLVRHGEAQHCNAFLEGQTAPRFNRSRWAPCPGLRRKGRISTTMTPRDRGWSTRPAGYGAGTAMKEPKAAGASPTGIVAMTLEIVGSITLTESVSVFAT